MCEGPGLSKGSPFLEELKVKGTTKNVKLGSERGRSLAQNC